MTQIRLSDLFDLGILRRIRIVSEAFYFAGEIAVMHDRAVGVDQNDPVNRRLQPDNVGTAFAQI